MNQLFLIISLLFLSVSCAGDGKLSLLHSGEEESSTVSGHDDRALEIGDDFYLEYVGIWVQRVIATSIDKGEPTWLNPIFTKETVDLCEDTVKKDDIKKLTGLGVSKQVIDDAVAAFRAYYAAREYWQQNPPILPDEPGAQTAEPTDQQQPQEGAQPEEVPDLDAATQAMSDAKTKIAEIIKDELQIKWQNLPFFKTVCSSPNT